MIIEGGFNYNASCDELADEFCTHDSDYQAETINEIGLQFKIWSQDRKRKTPAHGQILEITRHLNDDGKWFIKTLCKYMDGDSEEASKAESEE